MAKTKTKKTTLAALSHLGLGENEAVLYTRMLEHPKATVQDILEKRKKQGRTDILTNHLNLYIIRLVD